MMTLPPETLPDTTAELSIGETDLGEPAGSVLIPQPDRPTLPIRVPVDADFGGSVLHAEVIGSTANVVLLQGPATGAAIMPLGAPVRLRVDWDRQTLKGRLAAHGVEGRFLVSIGERAIRSARRFPVDLPGLAKSPQFIRMVEVRVIDLSTGGARIQGIDLPVGSDIELRFTPPGRPEPITVVGFVVRAMERDGLPSIGLAFRMAQPSLDLLHTAPSSR
jgi:hypothetical protein